MALLRAALLVSLLWEAAGLRSKRGDPDDPESGHYGPAAYPEVVWAEEIFELGDIVLPNNTRFLVYYVYLPSNKKRYVGWYNRTLTKVCRTARKLLASQTNLVNTTFSIVGSGQWVAENVPDCGFMVQKGTPDVNFAALRYNDSGTHLWNNCSFKFSTMFYPNIFADVVKVWLNKLDSACSPFSDPFTLNSTTVLMDVGLLVRDVGLFGQALEVPKHLEDGKLGMPHYNLGGHFRESMRWFGQSSCRNGPVYLAMFMAIHMRDCSTILRAFTQALHELEHNKTCGCFDEEMVFAQMHTHPEMKAMIQTHKRWTR